MSNSVQNIRNVCLLGHSGSGKSALAESLLYMTGAIDRMGRAVDGNTVWFLDKDVHGSDEVHRMVDIVGNVAPGEIIIESNLNAGFVDPKAEDAEYHMEYSYAFVSKDGTGCITDYVDAEGEEIPTSITMKGTGLVVLNLTNNFSGGIDVQNGGIYVATVGAAGTGALTFHTDQEWSFNVQGLSNGVVDTPMERLGSELMICYQHSDDAVSGFRGSSLRNDIILSSTKTTAENDFAGRFKEKESRESAALFDSQGHALNP